MRKKAERKTHKKKKRGKVAQKLLKRGLPGRENSVDLILSKTDRKNNSFKGRQNRKNEAEGGNGMNSETAKDELF